MRLASGVLAATLSLGAFSSAAHAATETPEPGADAPFRFQGRALYLGAGAGVIADIAEPTAGARFLLTLPIFQHGQFEVGGFGDRFSAVDHHGERVASSALGIALGLRIAASPTAVVRPYGAFRVTHVHLTPDPWGEHPAGAEGGSENHISLHRWGAALAGGFDVGLGGPASRWRFGIDAETMALSGPGSNLFIQGLAMLGVGF